MEPDLRAKLKDPDDDLRLIEDLGIDSLTMMEIVILVEEVLQMSINNEELRHLRTIGDVKQFIECKVRGLPLPKPTKFLPIEQIAGIMPIQPPFLFLSEASVSSHGASAKYKISGQEFFLQGHFKDNPVMPASIMLEAIGQLAVLFLLEGGVSEPGKVVNPATIFFTSCEGVRCPPHMQTGRRAQHFGQAQAAEDAARHVRGRDPRGAGEGGHRRGDHADVWPGRCGRGGAGESRLRPTKRAGIPAGRDQRLTAIAISPCRPADSGTPAPEVPTLTVVRRDASYFARNPAESSVHSAGGGAGILLIFPIQRMRKVYITGIGLVTSIGNDVPTVPQNLRALRHGFELYPPFQKPDVPVKVVGTIKDFVTDSPDPEDWLYPPRYTIKREVLRGLAPNSLYAYCAMLQAIDDARLAPEDVSNLDTGLYAASGGSPFLTHLPSCPHAAGGRDALFAAGHRGLDRRHAEFQPCRHVQDLWRVLRFFVGLRLVLARARLRV